MQPKPEIGLHCTAGHQLTLLEFEYSNCEPTAAWKAAPLAIELLSA